MRVGGLFSLMLNSVAFVFDLVCDLALPEDCLIGNRKVSGSRFDTWTRQLL